MNNFDLDLWDTAGQEKYESLTPMYYRGSDYVFKFLILLMVIQYIIAEEK